MADVPNELKFDHDDSDVKFLVQLGEDPFYLTGGNYRQG